MTTYADTPLPTLREATMARRRMMRDEVAGTRTQVAEALARVRKTIEDGDPVNGLRSALDTAATKLAEVEGILHRTEEEQFKGDRG